MMANMMGSDGLLKRISAVLGSLEPVSKLFEHHHHACQLDEAEDVGGVILPRHQEPQLPLHPLEEALHDPAALVAPQTTAVLHLRPHAIGLVRLTTCVLDGEAYGLVRSREVGEHQMNSGISLVYCRPAYRTRRGTTDARLHLGRSF